MLQWATPLVNYLNSLVYPQPPASAVYGFRWQAGAGVPNALTIYDTSGNIPAGIYVAFTGSLLDDLTDPFGRVGPGAPGPVFVAPPVPSAAVASMVTQVAHNPPPGEGGWLDPAPGRLADLTGFLGYAANCLDLINQTAAGATLLTGLDSGRFNAFISPGLLSNQAFAASIDSALDTLTRAAGRYAAGGPVPKDVVNAAVQRRYSAVGGTLAKYNQLAADMNAAPLYSLFVPGANFQANYLYTRFRFRGARLSGQNLFNWLSDKGFAVFDQTLRGMTVPGPDGVALLSFFLLALCVALYPAAVPGPGTGAGIKFYVMNDQDNQQGTPSFRPPAIGLAHELMHARHYTGGTAPGYEINHYSTTTAELMFAGIGPSATDPVNENAVRNQWAGIAGPVDPSNVWAAPAPRLVYEAPVPPQTAQAMRQRMQCI